MQFERAPNVQAATISTADFQNLLEHLIDSRNRLALLGWDTASLDHFLTSRKYVREFSKTVPKTQEPKLKRKWSIFRIFNE